MPIDPISTKLYKKSKSNNEEEVVKNFNETLKNNGINEQINSVTLNYLKMMSIDKDQKTISKNDLKALSLFDAEKGISDLDIKMLNAEAKMYNKSGFTDKKDNLAINMHNNINIMSDILDGNCDKKFDPVLVEKFLTQVGNGEARVIESNKTKTQDEEKILEININGDKYQYILDDKAKSTDLCESELRTKINKNGEMTIFNGLAIPSQKKIKVADPTLDMDNGQKYVVDNVEYKFHGNSDDYFTKSGNKNEKYVLDYNNNKMIQMTTNDGELTPYAKTLQSDLSTKMESIKNLYKALEDGKVQIQKNDGTLKQFDINALGIDAKKAQEVVDNIMKKEIKLDFSMDYGSISILSDKMRAGYHSYINEGVEGTLGHEIGHVSLKNKSRNISQEERTVETLGGLANLYKTKTPDSKGNIIYTEEELNDIVLAATYFSFKY